MDFLRERRNNGKGPLINPFEILENPQTQDIQDLLIDFEIPKGNVIVSSLEEFQNRFNNLTSYFFDDFNWEGITVAGGIILTSIHPYYQSEYDRSDIDIYFYGENHQENVERTISFFARKKIHHTISQFGRTLSFRFNPPYRTVQLILPLFRDISQVIYTFDIIPAAIAYDGQQLLATEEWKNCLINRYFPITDEQIFYTPERAVYRALKYLKRGFRIQMKDRKISHYENLLLQLSNFDLRKLKSEEKHSGVEIEFPPKPKILDIVIDPKIFLERIKLESFKNEFYTAK